VPDDVEDATSQERWGRFGILKLFIYFECWALFGVFLSIPWVLLAVEPLQRITAYEWAGFLLWLIGVAGATVSETQLKHFMSDPDNEGQPCQVGFWHYFRHPDYVFEGLVWFAYFLAALSTPYGAWTILCPLFVLVWRAPRAN
jgi:steroid 5-alpha reductase family enzyme